MVRPISGSARSLVVSARAEVRGLQRAVRQGGASAGGLHERAARADRKIRAARNTSIAAARKQFVQLVMVLPAAALVFLFLVFLRLRDAVGTLRPIGQMRMIMRKLARQRKIFAVPADRIQLQGSDEIALMTRDFDALLDHLQASVNLARRQERRLRTLIREAPDAIITTDGAGMIQSFNPAAERIFGYESDEVVGRNISVLFPL